MNNIPKQCKIEGCLLAGHKSKKKSEQRYFTRGYCSTHYKRWLKYGDPSIVKIPQHTYKKHGLWGTPEYHAWLNMKNRCYSKINKAYIHYGGRGIIVCDGWRLSLKSFLDDIGKRPTNKHSLDRIDNSLSYTCGHCKQCIDNDYRMNCKWSTQKEQINNRRSLKSRNDLRYIYKSGRNSYRVAKVVGGKYISYGSFRDINEAKKLALSLYD